MYVYVKLKISLLLIVLINRWGFLYAEFFTGPFLSQTASVMLLPQYREAG
jgi:hypothetical protein